MPDDDRPPTPFDEQAAREELERLQRAVVEARRRRTERMAAFDDFVRSFRRDPAAASGNAPASALAVPAAHPLQPFAPVEDVPTEPVAWPEEKRLPRGRWAAMLGGTGVLIAAGILLPRMWRGNPATTGAVEMPPTAIASTSGAVDRRDPPAELTALRRVWVRVLVDGERALERELETHARVPLSPGRTIVIRTGDAGAVRLLLHGRDQGSLGRDGEVVTRTFTVPPSPER